MYISESLQISQKEAPTQVFSCEICEIFKNTYFEEHLGRGGKVAELETNDCLKQCGSKLNNSASFCAEDKKKPSPEVCYMILVRPPFPKKSYGLSSINITQHWIFTEQYWKLFLTYNRKYRSLSNQPSDGLKNVILRKNSKNQAS